MGTICWKCGKEVPAGAAACAACGAAIAGTGSQAAQPFSSPAAAPFGSVPSAAPQTPAFSSGQGYTAPPPPPAPSYPLPPAPPMQASAPPAPPAFSPVGTGQPSFAPAAAGYTPAPPPPMPPAGLQPATGGGGGSMVVKIVLIVIAVIVALFLLIGAVVGYGIWRVARAAHRISHGESVTIPGANGGSFAINSGKVYTAAELGADIYPGATAAHGSMKMELPTGSMVTGVFVTSDPRDRVVSFYKSKFGEGSGLMEGDDATVLTLKKSDKEQVMVTVSQQADRDEGKTKIAIVHTTSR